MASTCMQYVDIMKLSITVIVGGSESEFVWKAERIKSDDVPDGRQKGTVKRRPSEPVVDTGRLELITHRATGVFVYKSQSIRPLHSAAFAPVQVDLCHHYHHNWIASSQVYEVKITYKNYTTHSIAHTSGERQVR